MSPFSKTLRPRLLLAVAAAGALMGGCSELYTERRETVALYANDAVETNKVLQMSDPWPAVSARRSIAFNGEKMQSAVERYRTNRVTPPVNATTSSVQYQQAQQAANAATVNAGQNAPAAAVK